MSKYMRAANQKKKCRLIQTWPDFCPSFSQVSFSWTLNSGQRCPVRKGAVIKWPIKAERHICSVSFAILVNTVYSKASWCAWHQTCAIVRCNVGLHCNTDFLLILACLIWKRLLTLLNNAFRGVQLNKKLNVIFLFSWVAVLRTGGSDH